MEKDTERNFIEMLSRALVQLPYDVKVLLEAVSDPDLEHDVREVAAATVVHVITPKDGNVEPMVRHTEDVLLVRLALRKIQLEGGDEADAFVSRFNENYERLEEELSVFRQVCGAEVVDWLDSKWGALRKTVFAKKRISMFVDDEEVGTFLYDEGLRFATDYPISEKTLEGRLKQVQPFIDHLVKKREQDLKKIHT